jgi:RNA polymerase sigma-70 factor, ECF subfamily
VQCDEPGQDAVHLMARIAAGQEAALAQLIALQGRGVTLFAARMLGNAADGEDVAQETFLRVWRRAASYDPTRAKVSTWIYAIATNLCIDRQRRNRVWRFLGHTDVADLVDVLPDDGPDATTAIAGRQRLAAVRAGIAALPARQRTAILLAAVAELGVSEIAVTMATSRGAVEQLLVRARRKLRDDIGDDDGI